MSSNVIPFKRKKEINTTPKTIGDLLSMSEKLKIIAQLSALPLCFIMWLTIYLAFS